MLIQAVYFHGTLNDQQVLSTEIQKFVQYLDRYQLSRRDPYFVKGPSRSLGQVPYEVGENESFLSNRNIHVGGD